MAAVTRLGLYGGTRSLYGSFEGKAEQEIVVVTGGIKAKKRKIKVVDRNFFPWTQQPDPIEEEFVKELKRPKLKIVKRAPQPDFDSTLESERLDRELVEELQRIEKERKARARRHKKIIMLLLS